MTTTKTQIFISLPVANVPRTVAFFKALGFSHNPAFTDDTAACIVISEEISVMALSHAKFRELSPKPVCDTSKSLEALFCLSFESREKVKDLVAKAVALGATTHEGPQDHGFMYQESFIDLDGHGWAFTYFSGTLPPESCIAQ